MNNTEKHHRDGGGGGGAAAEKRSVNYAHTSWRDGRVHGAIRLREWIQPAVGSHHPFSLQNYIISHAFIHFCECKPMVRWDSVCGAACKHSTWACAVANKPYILQLIAALPRDANVLYGQIDYYVCTLGLWLRATRSFDITSITALFSP